MYAIRSYYDLNASNLQQAKQSLAKARSLIGSTDPEIQEIEAWIADGHKEYSKAAASYNFV